MGSHTLPASLRLALAAHPGWWREHYGADAESTAEELIGSGRPAGPQAVGLLLSATWAHLRGPGRLRRSPTDAATFVPTNRWRIARVLAIFGLLWGLALLLASGGFTVWLVVTRSRAWFQWRAPWVVTVHFNWVRAGVWALTLAIGSLSLAVTLVGLIRARRPQRTSARTAWALTPTILLVITAVALGISFKDVGINQFWGWTPTTSELVLLTVILIPFLVAIGAMAGRWVRFGSARLVGGLLLVLILVAVAGWASVGPAHQAADIGLPTTWLTSGFWTTTPSLAQPETGPGVLSCSDPAHCLVSASSYVPAGGSAVPIAVAGRTDISLGAWESITIPAVQINDLACWDNFHCVASASTEVQGQACWYNLQCLGSFSADGPVQTVALRSDDDGKTWVTASLGFQVQGPGVLACSSEGNCMMLADAQPQSYTPFQPQPEAVLVSNDGGATWRHRATIQLPSTPGVGPLETGSLACPTPTTCVVVGGAFTQLTNPGAYAEWTTDGGSTWTPSLLPKGTPPLGTVDCQSATSCDAATSGDGVKEGTASRLLSTTDSGENWTSRTLTPTATYLQSLSCPDVSTCWAAGTSYGVAHLYGTTNGGSTWTVVNPPGGTWVTSLVCPDTLECIAFAVDGQPKALLLTTDNGWKSWRTVTPPPIRST